MGRSASRARPPAARTGRQGSVLWWGGLGCGAMIMLSPGSAALVAALLVPVLLVAMLPGEGVGSHVSRAALLFGLAASIHPLRLLWDDGATLDMAMGLLRQPLILLTSWTAILAGWFTAELASMILRLTYELKAASARRALDSMLAELEEEWGAAPSPAGPAP